MDDNMDNINRIYCGDNLEIMRTFPDEFVDLIYLDPPFFSGRNYEVIWGDKDEVRSFDDRWEGGIMHYIGWMSERLKEMYRILKPTGSIYLHCDWHASHYLKVEMDKIFGNGDINKGMNYFQNEIIWHYRGRGMQKGRFQRKHDIIFFYSKSNKFIFNSDKVKVPLDPNHISRYNKMDETGKKYALIKKKGGDYSQIYLKEDGIVMDDVWDLPFIHGNESLGYPTQKPEALLERIIKASSNKDDLVCDPFCGCGTTLAVAKKLNRKFIGIDISPVGCHVMAKRIGYPEFDIVGLPTTTDDLTKMRPHEFQQWVCDKMLARNTSKKDKPSGGDGGKDGVVLSNLSTGKYGGSPIQVKQSDSVGVNVVKNLFATMHDLKVKKGFVIALSFGSGAVEQVAKYKLEDDIEITLIKAEDLCNIPHYNYNTRKIKTSII